MMRDKWPHHLASLCYSKKTLRCHPCDLAEKRSDVTLVHQYPWSLITRGIISRNVCGVWLRLLVNLPQ